MIKDVILFDCKSGIGKGKMEIRTSSNGPPSLNYVELRRTRGWKMKKWILVEAAMVVAIVFLSCLIKMQLTPAAQAQEIQDNSFELLVQTENGLLPYSQVKIVKVEAKGSSYLFPYRQDVQQRIRELEPEIADTLILLADCESTLNPWAVGDNGNSHGLYQIYLSWHPDVSQEQAQDIEFATRWAANKIRQGQGHLWTCWSKI